MRASSDRGLWGHRLRKVNARRAISAVSGVEWHRVDDLTWEPGWVEVSTAEQRRRIAAICERPEWILDTAYSKWLEVPLARADLIVALDYPRWFSLQRLLRRTMSRVFQRRLICNGNRESLRILFSRDSIILLHFASFPRKRARIRQWGNDSSGPPIIRLATPRQTENWLADLARGQLQPRHPGPD